MPDALELLIEDHRRVEKLFGRLEGTAALDSEVLALVVKELSIHDAVEKELLYPVVAHRVDDGNDVAQRSIAEHGETSRLLAEIDRRPADDPQRRVLVDRLIPVVRAHVGEEEDQIFPLLAARMAPEELQELGEALVAAKAKAPTRPHPHAPHSALGNKLARAAAAPLDKARDAVRHRA